MQSTDSVNCPLLESDDEDNLPNTFLPVKDSYPSDDEKDNEAREVHYETTYNGSPFTLHEIQKYFQLVFHPKSQHPQNIDNMGLPEILDNLLFFLTKRHHVKGAEVIKKVEEFCLKEALSVDDSPLLLMQREKEYGIDMRNEWELLGECDRLAQKIVMNFFTSLGQFVNSTYYDQAVNSHSYNYAVLKMTVNKFLSIIGENTIESGAAVSHIISSGSPQCKSRAQKEPISFIARPDVVLKQFSLKNLNLGIPVEICSPSKHCVKQVKKTSTKNDSPPSDNTATDEQTILKLQSFLTQVLPQYDVDDQDENSLTPNTFVDKLTAQHLVQIISNATDYVIEKHRLEIILQKNQVFIGLLVCNQNVYLSKITGDDKCCLKFADLSLDEERKGLGFISNEDPALHVEFCPMVFSLLVHNHRMALLFFLKYYLCNREKLTVEPI